MQFRMRFLMLIFILVCPLLSTAQVQSTGPDSLEVGVFVVRKPKTDTVNSSGGTAPTIKVGKLFEGVDAANSEEIDTESLLPYGLYYVQFGLATEQDGTLVRRSLETDFATKEKLKVYYEYIFVDTEHNIFYFASRWKPKKAYRKVSRNKMKIRDNVTQGVYYKDQEGYLIQFDDLEDRINGPIQMRGDFNNDFLSVVKQSQQNGELVADELLFRRLQMP